MKKAIIIGHNIRRKGAYSPHLEISEFDFFNDMKSELGKFADVFLHDSDIRNYELRMKATASEIDKGNYDAIFALHFNSFHNPTARGVEALVWHSNTIAYSIAHRLCIDYSNLAKIPCAINHDIYKHIPLRNTHIVPISKKTDRGFWEIAAPKAPVILFEPFFGSSFIDCSKVNPDHIVKVLKNIR